MYYIKFSANYVNQTPGSIRRRMTSRFRKAFIPTLLSTGETALADCKPVTCLPPQKGCGEIGKCPAGNKNDGQRLRTGVL